MKMKAILYAGAATTALLGTSSALADVFVQADIFKDKDIIVFESISIDKFVDIDVDVISSPEKAAEAMGIINQENFNNEACGNCAEKVDEIIGSIGGGSGGANTGIINVNQSSGNMNNQGNAVSVAVDAADPPSSPPPPNVPPPPPESTGGFANSQAHIEQVNGEENEEGEGNLVDTVNLLFRDAVIEDSINDNQGIVNVNQSPGSMNNQANLVSVAVSFAAGGVALSEADLGQVNSANRVQESESQPYTNESIVVGIQKSATIDGSIIGNSGIINVNQAAGNMANQANNVSAAAVVVGGL